MSDAGAPRPALEIEVLDAPVDSAAAYQRAARLTLARLGIDSGHVAVSFVDAGRIQELNRDHRGKDAPTDVLSFPVDGEWIARAWADGETLLDGDEPADPIPPDQWGGEPPPDADDELEALADPTLELGDVVICPAHTGDLLEAVVHGVLHLCGFDHEVDQGEMLDLQDAIVESLEDEGDGAA